MTSRSTSTLRRAGGVAAIATLALSAAACSSAPGGGEPSPAGQAGASASSAVAPAAAAARLDEASRVQAYLDSLYLRTDVRHEFKSKLGDDIDCVDFAAEPGVRQLLAQGLTLEDIRGDGDGRTDAMKEHDRTATLNDAYFAGDPDDAGRARACPAGTVPHVRMTPEKIAAAGGLDAHLHALHRGPKPSPRAESSPPPGGPTYDWYQWVTSDWSVANTGGTSTMTIAKPTIPAGVNDHSLEQTWTLGGSGTGEQSLEVGWTVADDVNGDLEPHIFIYSTDQGYQESTSCYDGITVAGCPTWIPVGGSLTVGGSLASYVSTAGGTPQHELTVTTAHHRTGHLVCNRIDCVYVYTSMDGWGFWASVDGGPTVLLGYYTLGSYGSGALSGGRSDEFEMGAEVCDTSGVFSEYTPNVQMGEGSPGFERLGKYWWPNPLSGHSAYQRNYAYFNTSGILGASGASVSTGASAAANQVGSLGGGNCTSSCVYEAGDETNPAENTSTWTNWFYFADVP